MYLKLSFLCFVLGIAFFVIGFLIGEVKTGFLLIFPFLIGSGLYALLGFLFFFAAILLFMFGLVSPFIAPEKPEVKGGGVILIGPFPIVFGSSWRIAILLMLMAIILIVLVVLFKLHFY
jgi:uncharacterized membrane protein